MSDKSIQTGNKKFQLVSKRSQCDATPRNSLRQPCQGWGRGFESLRPLHNFNGLQTNSQLGGQSGPAPGDHGETAGELHRQIDCPRPNIVAVELFVTQAKALDEGFSSQPEDNRSIAVICRHLDGIPLAIERAATHSNLLRPGAQDVVAPAGIVLLEGLDQQMARHFHPGCYLGTR